MAQITAKAVAELRAKTGCGMMECKKALVATDGDFDAAVKHLREKGLAVAEKKAGRIAAEGIVDIGYSADGNTVAIIEVNSETDFVAKNADFQSFVKGVLEVIINKRPADVDALMALDYKNGMTVEAALKDKIFTTGEKLSIRRFAVVEGKTSSYIHGKGTSGVIVKFTGDDAALANEGFAEYAKNIALQVSAMNALYVGKEDVPQAVIDEELQIIMTQIKNEPANAKKPDNIIQKMATGKLGKFYETNCLSEQSYVKDDALTVGKYTAACAKEFGGAIKIDSFVKFERGEGIQKREENFADEIAKMIK